MNKLFAILLSFLVLLSGAFAYGQPATDGQTAYGQAPAYGQQGYYSTGGSWAFPSTNSSAFEQGAEYTIRSPYVVDAEFPAERGYAEGIGYGDPYAGLNGYQGMEPYGYQGMEPYGYAGYAQPQPYPPVNVRPWDDTVDNLGNGYVSVAYNAGGLQNLPQQSYNQRVFDKPLYSEAEIVLYEDGQGFTLQEGETAFKNIYIKNESAEPLYVDEIRVNENSSTFNVKVVGSLSVVLPRQQAGVKLALEGLSVASDEEGTAEVTVIGHYPSFEAHVIGPKTFLVYVNAEDAPLPLPTPVATQSQGMRTEFTQTTRPMQVVTEAPHALDVEVLNFTEAVRIIDNAEVKVTLKNNAGAPKKAFVDVVSDKVDVRGMDVTLAANETRTVTLEAKPLTKEEGVFNAALIVTVDGLETRKPMAFQIEKLLNVVPLPGPIEALGKAGTTALASLGTGAWLIGLLVVLLVAGFLLKDKLGQGTSHLHEQVWVGYKASKTEQPNH